MNERHLKMLNILLAERVGIFTLSEVIQLIEIATTLRTSSIEKLYDDYRRTHALAPEL